jgi:shikimate dehydrogenase
VRALPAAGYRGLNVTVPHKAAAFALADRASPAAAAIGAANTLTFTADGIEAENTDAPGLIAALGEPVEGRTALVLGAGGAGRAAAWALREAGADVSVWNRTSGRARSLAEELGTGHAERPESAEVVVNATSVGLDSEADAVEELGLARYEPPPVLVDLVYSEGGTALSRWAREGGSRVVDGLEVLVRQGALSLELWTGLDAPLATMRAAVQDGLDTS